MKLVKVTNPSPSFTLEVSSEELQLITAAVGATSPAGRGASGLMKDASILYRDLTNILQDNELQVLRYTQ